VKVLTLRKFLLTALVCVAANAWAVPKPSDCPSGCLLDLVNHSLDAMIEHNAAALPLAPGARLTENGKVVQPGDGLWKTAQAIVYRQTVVDPEAGQAMFFGAIQEPDGQAMLALRFAVAGGKITELESMVARKGAHALYNPDGLRTVQGIWTSPVPVEERLSRDKLIEIANSYFDGIEKHSADAVPFHPDCMRNENGVRTTNSDSSEGMRLGCSAGFKNLAYIQSVRGRRYPLVDVERGLVVAIVHFDVPGQPAPAAASNDTGTQWTNNRRTLFLYELFKVEQGRIREILAFMRNEPLGASNGWEK
jgi:hypothetical protein